MPVQTSDVYNTNNVGLGFSAADLTWIIDSGVFVGSESFWGVGSEYARSTLINNGNVFGTSGVLFAVGIDDIIINNQSSSIIGAYSGVKLEGTGATTITNHGFIGGYRNSGVLFFGNSANVTLNNDGEIYGRGDGVYANSPSDGGTINNSGLIRSDHWGVHVFTSAVLRTVISNAAGGIIIGIDAAILTDTAGRISLDNAGRIVGKIDCVAFDGNPDDVVVNRGTITGNVELGDGNDSFNGTAGRAVTVMGEQGNDLLFGGSAADVLSGGPGRDTVRGGRGKDVLFGGSERDVFDFNVIADSIVGSKRDAISDFQHGIDLIDVSGIDAVTNVAGNQAFKFIGRQAFHGLKGELRFSDLGSSCLVQGDVDGDGMADFDILVKSSTLSAGDFVL